MNALFQPDLLLQSSAGATDPALWPRGQAHRITRVDAIALRRPQRQFEPSPVATFVAEPAFFAAATHDDKVTHLAALHAGSHWLLCSGREPTVRLAAGPHARFARQFATINDVYRYARSLAPRALKFDIR